jgi:hypothetical protein
MIAVVVDLYIYGHSLPPIALDTALAPSYRSTSNRTR